MHGDAAFAGQGVVMETLNLAQTRGYGTGGTLHIVINNQIGFTTSDPRDTRSTLYCSDVVKMIEAPVLHVNGDDPEAVVLATQIALDYRLEFKKDIVVDIVCFRKLGHNEQDTPALTQPLMYKKIAQHPGTRKLYADKLAAQGTIPAEGGDALVKAYRDAMDAGKHTIDPVISNFKSKYAVDWMPFLNRKWTDAADTAVPLSELKRLATRITTVPENFKVHPLVEKVLSDRAAMGRGEMNLDWGMGEHLAYASLVSSGYAIRLTGQDAGRGTFTHRHAVLHDQNRERWDAGSYIPLQNVSDNQAPFTVIDSVLSEEAVLGFEYGYSTAEPNTLTIWEAQFGDFANGAQVVIDQFISSGEVKWGRASGPGDDAAARLRRPGSGALVGAPRALPAAVRRQQHASGAADHRRADLPPAAAPDDPPVQEAAGDHDAEVAAAQQGCRLALSDLAKGTFQTVIGEVDEKIDPKKVKRVIACSGKVYYDLVNARKERGQSDTAIIRIEQLYPFPHKAFAAELKKFPNFTELVWAQDEPQNQGPWFQIQHNIFENMESGQRLAYAGRPASASPAVGYYDKHYAQQKALLDTAFCEAQGLCPDQINTRR